MDKQQSRKYIPFSSPDIGEDEIREVTATLRSGWITSGPRTKQLEREFCEYTGAKYALAVNSCTAGLHLAMVALGIGAGDEVITSPLTFCATVNAILQTGAKPVLADIGADFNLDVDAAARAITPRTRAILPVHIAGLPCNMSAIHALAGDHRLAVIEDAAHAVGSTYDGLKIGAGSSDVVAFSFYATKNLTTGEGGMVTTANGPLHERMRTLCLHGISHDAWDRYSEKGNWYYEVVEQGYKYNMSDIHAAIGIHQLRKLDKMNERRAAIAARYNAAFRFLKELQVPPGGQGHAWHLYLLRLNLPLLRIDRSKFIENLRSEGIGCSVHFIPIPLHPYYRKTLEMRDPCSRTMEEFPRVLSLPLHSRIEAVRPILFCEGFYPHE